MKFIAEKITGKGVKGVKKKVVSVEGNFLVEKQELSTSQVKRAFKRRKDQLKKDGWSITHVQKTKKPESKQGQGKRKGPPRKKRKTTRILGREVEIEDEK